MKVKPNIVVSLIREIDDIIKALKASEIENADELSSVCQTYYKSARNLIHYHTLRKQDLRSIQKKLKSIGMSRLANAEGHVLASLLNTRFILHRLIENDQFLREKPGLSIKNGEKLLINHTKELLGFRSKGRRVRIMVTQPTQASKDYQMVYEMVKNGMNCARINCAHDDQAVWKRIITHVKKASKALGRKVIITMDLGGPKIRTGTIIPGAKVRKFTPERDDSGKVINPALIILVPYLTEESNYNEIPVDVYWLKQLSIGDKIDLQDTRSKSRTLKVVAVSDEGVYVNCYDSAYLGTGTLLQPKNKKHASCEVGELPPNEQSLLLRVNDILTIHYENIPGEPAYFDEEGNLLQQAHISCQIPEVFKAVNLGDSVLFDDGKIEGVVSTIESEKFDVKILKAKETGSKLRTEKGMNFPKTDLKIKGMTDKDKEDLAFIVNHADVVNYSFVNSKEDVELLHHELKKHQVENKLNVILKIETRRAFDNLMEILLSAMQMHYVGVMIARGDLAVETGWGHIGWVQKEIISVCNASHIPVIWATQVLENMAKKGLPSRSEITDATSSLKAECVMLNKGTYINDAIRLLDRILSDMENFSEKNQRMLPQLEKFGG